MTYIDAALLNALEWFCHQFQRLTGRTNVWLAAQLTNLSIVMYFVWAAMYFWNTDFTLRLSVGLEDVEDLWADLDRALGTASGPGRVLREAAVANG